MFNSIAKYYNEIFPLKREKLNFIKSVLPEGCESILDIGCATGELVHTLAEENYSVIGIDLDKEMINTAESLAIKGKSEFYVMDMRDISNNFKPSNFNAVLCTGNTLSLLGYLNSIESEIIDIHRLLKPAGLFLCQMVNYEKIIKNHEKKFPVIETDRLKFERFYEFTNPDKIEFITKLTIQGTGEVISGTQGLYPLKFNEMKQIFEKHGFKRNDFYGDFSGNPYNGNLSSGLISVSRK